MAKMHDSPLLVLVHALGADASMWSEYSALVEPEIRTLAPDLFGVGATRRHGTPPSTSDHAAHLVELLQDEGDGIIMAGCAIGSMVAAETALRLADRVLGLVMANPIVRIAGPAGEVLLNRAVRARAGGIEAVADEVMSRGFEGLGSEARPEQFRKHLLAMSGDSYADLCEGIQGCDVSEALRSLTCPILLVPGGQDRVLPASHVSDIAALNERVRVVPAPTGGHFLPHQSPDEFAEATLPFLRALALEKA